MPSPLPKLPPFPLPPGHESQPKRPERTPGFIGEAWVRLKRFILPDESVSLKVVFDNVRNYLICAAVIAAFGATRAQWQDPPGGSWSWGLALFAVLFLGANALQSLLIVNRIAGRVGRFQKEVRPSWVRWRRRLFRLLLVVLVAPIIWSAYQGFFALMVWAIAGGQRGAAL